MFTETFCKVEIPLQEEGGRPFDAKHGKHSAKETSLVGTAGLM